MMTIFLAFSVWARWNCLLIELIFLPRIKDAVPKRTCNFITWDIQKSSCLMWTMTLYGYRTNWKNILPFQGISWLFHWES